MLLIVVLNLLGTFLCPSAFGRHILQPSSAASPNAASAAANQTAAAANTAAASGQLATQGNASSLAKSFRGYPDSAGLLAPELQQLLVTIQDARLYNDSKTAVDLVLKGPVADTAAAFKSWQLANGTNSTGSTINKTLLQQFVNATLDPAGSDLIECRSSDWQPRPAKFLLKLATAANSSSNTSSSSINTTGTNATAAELFDFGLKVHSLWGLLCREVSPNVSAHPERHSLLPLPNRTVVPGDRFREVYYWDSYWVVRGLIVSQMFNTAEGLVDNLMSMLEHVGHVPNGARVYYLNRSQPPLLSSMVMTLYDASPNANKTQLLRRALPLLLTEHQYWTSSPKQVKVKAPNGKVYNMSRYWADWYKPRPESYREDAELAKNVTGTSDLNNPAAARLYHDLASGAESGWDYSSRWFADNRTLATIRTTQIVPADLNAWLYQMENNIAEIANITGDNATRDKFKQAAATRKEAIQALLWDDKAGQWRDGILSPTLNTTNRSGVNPDQVFTLRHNPGIFASNFVPLWTGLTAGNATQGAQVVQALNNSGLIGPAGVATTIYQTGQQWDYPNGWPPLQHMLIEGADRYGGAEGKRLAQQLARTWVGVNLNVYNATGAMHEKYDVSAPGGLIGGGGEYKPQVGFGWSNGVLLDLLSKYS